MIMFHFINSVCICEYVMRIQQLNYWVYLISIINLINKMSLKVMHLDNLYDFSLVRCEPQSIILLDKNSRKPYQFYQMANLHCILPDIAHPSLLRPVLYKNGVLYAKGCEDLATLLEARRRNYNPSRYSHEEIVNTFEPVLECLEFLHKKGIYYYCLSSEHITFFENGDILLKDWLFKQADDQSNSECCKTKDMKNLGFILAEAATLIPINQLRKLTSAEIASMVLEFYSPAFCSGVVILLEGLSKQYSLILNLLSGEVNDCKTNQVKSIVDEAAEIKSIRDKQKSKIKQQPSKLLKEVENQKPKIETPRKQQMKYQSVMNQTGSIQGSPTKKFNITTPNKKLIRLEDCENKKVFNQEVKKRQIQKITKIIERSNAFVNELMARKNNDKKYLNTVKINGSIHETQQNSKKTLLIKESPKIGSPTKRLRSISKKK